MSQTVLKHGAGSCPVGRVPADEIETAVIDQLRAVFRQPEIVAGTWKVARAQGADITEADVRAALQQFDPTIPSSMFSISLFNPGGFSVPPEMPPSSY